ncbi:hypothetical protein VP01_2561g3 [Puccinia sorghi]|uniref:Uncharacterized protein n=1 Tax=Puccinia sorghi TaxID=27349 RepID=A0A0L6V5R7_9BASI|nr:hypothetical protein VP01_2561g3 [Puccinia sorghi]
MGLNLGSDDCNHYMSWSLLLYSVTSMTLTDPKTGSLSLTIGTLSNTFHSAPSTLVLFLTFAQLPFREAMVQAMSLVYFSMYLTLLKGLSGLDQRTVKIIGIFLAIDKLHESLPSSCSILNIALPSTINVLLRSPAKLVSLILLRKTAISQPSSSTTGDQAHLFPKKLFVDFYNLAEDWSNRAMNPSASQSKSSHTAQCLAGLIYTAMMAFNFLDNDLWQSSSYICINDCHSLHHYLDFRVASGSQNQSKIDFYRVEKWKFWITLLKLENNYGTEVQFSKTLKEGSVSYYTRTIFLNVAEIYPESVFTLTRLFCRMEDVWKWILS